VASREPVANEVLIEVRAVSVNRTLDCVVRAGRYRIKPALPHVLGTDPAGIVSAAGDGVSNVRVGDRVSTTSIVACGQCVACQALDPAHCTAPDMLGVSIWGGYAEYVCLPSRNVTPIQADVSLAEASVISRHYSAAFHFVDGLAELQPGEWVLVMGAAGALGSAIVQVAKLRGATVNAVAAPAHPARREARAHDGRHANSRGHDDPPARDTADERRGRMSGWRPAWPTGRILASTTGPRIWQPRFCASRTVEA
jgi:NADPH:quinone reductase-like Zn-dependent oxidoreductase